MSPRVAEHLQGFWGRQRARAVARKEKQAVYYEIQKARVRLGIAGMIRPHSPCLRSISAAPRRNPPRPGGVAAGSDPLRLDRT